MGGYGRKSLASVFVALLFVSGCASPKKETPTERCNRECDGKSVIDTGCIVNAQTAIPEKSVDPAILPTLRGKLTLKRGASKSVCAHIYWTEFTPDPGNTEPFAVTAVISAVEETDDPSGILKWYRPWQTGRSYGYFAGVNGRANACVIGKVDGNSTKHFHLDSTVGT